MSCMKEQTGARHQKDTEMVGMTFGADLEVLSEKECQQQKHVALVAEELEIQRNLATNYQSILESRNIHTEM